MALVAEAKELPALSQQEKPFAAPTPVFSASGREESEAYPRVAARLNGRLRVIHGKCGLQWILQLRKSATRWESFAFCGTKEGLILRLQEYWRETFHKKARDLIPLETLVKLHCEPGAWPLIEGLPAYYPK